MQNFVKTIVVIFILVLNTFQTKAQIIIDTILLNNDSVVLFSNKQWEYLDRINFNGVTNKWLHDIIENDSNYNWKETWNNNVPYETNNDLSTMKDTLWICSVDSNHNAFCMPHPGMVTSTFKYRGKRFHYGIDVDLVTGDTLYAAFDGIVRYAQFNSGGFGNLLVIRHYNGLETFSAHLDKIFVSPNQDVKAGDPIGLGGKTGRAYGDHLHFEIRFMGNAIDPEYIIDFKNKRLRDENLYIHAGLFDYRATNTSKTTKASDVKYHKVKKGDSLYAIALRYHTSVDKLCSLNKIRSTSTLHIGQVLKVKE